MKENITINNEELSAKLHGILQKKFGFTQFRPGQFEAIATLLQYERLLCIQPTGHGKSLLYQLPATLFAGITIVISPLLALMRDQITQLNQRFKIPAASINSDQSDEENALAQAAATQGAIKILFISPEKLEHIYYFNFLLNLPVSFAVIDEAHCISTWGHDFRPSYRQIIHFIHAIEQKNKDLKVLAITATANQKTEEDIKNQLAQADKKVIVQRESMDRANINLSVIPTLGPAEKLYFISQLLKQLPGHGLIYCATRENTEMVAEYLQAISVSAAAYHAGLQSEYKRQLQDNFINNHYKVIAATNALGMGIDKQDLRFIIHFDVPGSITAYYQEVGRCGRDGNPAQGILLFDESDKKIQKYFIDSAQPAIDDFKNILESIKDTNIPPTLTDLKRETGLHPSRVNTVITELVEQEFVAKKSINKRQSYYLTEKKGVPDLSRYQAQYQVRIFELNEIIKYGEQSKDCLMKLLREALGDLDAQPCGHCNICNKTTFNIEKIKAEMTAIRNWLNQRTSPINPSVKSHVSEGIAVLNSQLRSPIFIEFMKLRNTAITLDNQELMELIKGHLTELTKKHAITTVIPIPSRTWLGRDNFAEFVAEILKARLLTHYLQWRKVPNARQGELFNNDQRRHNIDQHMQRSCQIPIANGPILLLDDYVGSGATLQEAVRVLRKEAKLKNTIIPFTIAMVKWRLGKRGMV